MVKVICVSVPDAVGNFGTVIDVLQFVVVRRIVAV